MTDVGDASILVVAESYLAHLRVERGLSRNTVESYKRDLARYVTWMIDHGMPELGSISTEMVGVWVAELRRGDSENPPLSPASVVRALAAVRGMHRFAIAEGLVGHDVTDEVRPNLPTRRLPKALPLDDVTAMIEAAAFDRTPIAARDVALLELLYGTGARISEVTGLAVDDVTRSDDVILLTGKGGKQRMVPVGRCAREALSDYLRNGRPHLVRAGSGPLLFLNTRGRALTRQSAWAVIRGAAHRAGIDEKVGPHTLRHSFATHLLQGGADVRSVQELLGHASVATTQIYTLVTADHLREVYAAAHPRARRSRLSTSPTADSLRDTSP